MNSSRSRSAFAWLHSLQAQTPHDSYRFVHEFLQHLSVPLEYFTLAFIDREDHMALAVYHDSPRIP